MHKNRENSSWNTDNTNHVDETNGISKTQKKNAMLALQALGESLIELKKNELEALCLPEKLFDAILEAKKITNWGGLKRQKQYIGRLMRDIDSEPIKTYLDALNHVSDTHNAWLHRLERLRESLLKDDKALQNLLTTYPNTDVQALRTLIRNTRKEREGNHPPKHFRALFQILKEIIPEPTRPIDRHHDNETN